MRLHHLAQVIEVLAVGAEGDCVADAGPQLGGNRRLVEDGNQRGGPAVGRERNQGLSDRGPRRVVGLRAGDERRQMWPERFELQLADDFGRELLLARRVAGLSSGSENRPTASHA